MTLGRRALLTGLGAVGLGALSGCLGRDPLSNVRSLVDGDGLVAAPTDELVAADSLVGATDHFVRYSLHRSTVQIYGGLLRNDYTEGARVWVTLSTYPAADRRSTAVAEGKSPVLTDVSEVDRTVTVSLDVDRVPRVPLFLQAFVVHADRDLASVDPGGGEKLCETDPLVVADGRLARYDHVHAHGSLTLPGYERQSAEGVYLLDFRGQTAGEDWDVSFVAYKSAYVREKFAQRKQRSQYVTDAMEDGTADAFGVILDAEAEANGFTTRRQKVDFLVDFVQNLPYVPDDVSTGYDDYTKHIVETLVEGGGDCEDTAVMLASLLQSPSFEYDTVLLLLPGHMAIGVYGDNLPGTYYEFDGRQYYYIETTGRGWDVGQVPDEYAHRAARVFQV